MNILFIKYFCVGFMVSEIPRVSVFGHFPYSVTFPYVYAADLYKKISVTVYNGICTISKEIRVHIDNINLNI